MFADILSLDHSNVKCPNDASCLGQRKARNTLVFWTGDDIEQQKNQDALPKEQQICHSSGRKKNEK